MRAVFSNAGQLCVSIERLYVADEVYDRFRDKLVERVKGMALRTGLAKGGERVVMMAGVPFGTPGNTNVLHVARLTGDELKSYKGPDGS